MIPVIVCSPYRCRYGFTKEVLTKYKVGSI